MVLKIPIYDACYLHYRPLIVNKTILFFCEFIILRGLLKKLIDYFFLFFTYFLHNCGEKNWSCRNFCPKSNFHKKKMPFEISSSKNSYFWTRTVVARFRQIFCIHFCFLSFFTFAKKFWIFVGMKNDFFQSKNKIKKLNKKWFFMIQFFKSVEHFVYFKMPL